MNRNAGNRFAVNPTNIDIQRSTFTRDTQHKTTMNVGKLVPLFVDEVLPGDTFILNESIIARMTTPITPVMDNAYIDTFYFFVPNRVLWEHWEEFMGQNDNSEWTQPVEYEIPQIVAPSGGWTKGTIMDYLGIPTNVDNISVNHLIPRAYCKIWNDWFRDQNNQSNVFFNTDETTLTGSNGNDYVTDAQLGGQCLPVAKFFDYYTGALPEPQKGESVLLPLGDSAPVYGNGDPFKLIRTATNSDPMYLLGLTQTNETQSSKLVGLQDVATGNLPTSNQLGGLGFADKDKGLNSGVYTDLTQATAATVNQLRQAFAIQRLLEKDARGGTRYIEMIKAHFGVTSSDARLQRAEYLGGKRIPINMMQVLQTSSTDGTSPQGNTAAYSLTSDNSSMFTKSFEEHGILMGVACIRTEHTYQQGIERMWSRKKRFDYYFPGLANLGEQAILNKEIYAQGTEEDDEVFGYQEAWAEYRYKPSRVSGAMRSNYTNSLDVWHYADNFNSLPTLSSEFIQETDANILRTLAVQDEDQFRVDIYFSIKNTRAMPMYSIPGLIDHH